MSSYLGLVDDLFGTLDAVQFLDLGQGFLEALHTRPHILILGLLLDALPELAEEARALLYALDQLIHFHFIPLMKKETVGNGSQHEASSRPRAPAELLVPLYCVPYVFREGMSLPPSSWHLLIDKHCLITGGSQGLGKAVAMELVQAGANVTIMARNETVLLSAATEIKVMQYSRR